MYIAYNVSGINVGLVAIDHNQNGLFDDGDTFIKLSGVNEASDILASDIVA